MICQHKQCKRSCVCILELWYGYFNCEDFLKILKVSIFSISAIKDAGFPKDVFGEAPIANLLFYVQWSQRCYFSQMRYFPTPNYVFIIIYILNKILSNPAISPSFCHIICAYSLKQKIMLQIHVWVFFPLLRNWVWRYLD